MAARKTRRRRPTRSREPLSRQLVEQLLFGVGTVRRFTQDTPVLPDVWFALAGIGEDGVPIVDAAPGVTAVRMLITPFRDTSAGAVRKELAEGLAQERDTPAWRALQDDAPPGTRLAYNQTTVAAELYFADLMRVVLPMTDWWSGITPELLQLLEEPEAREYWSKAVADPEHPPLFPAWEALVPPPAKGQRRRRRVRPKGWPESPLRPPPALLWTIRVAGALALRQMGKPLPRGFTGPRGIHDATPPDWEKVVDAFAETVRDLRPPPDGVRIFSVSRNRSASASVSKSTLAVKADAARRLFDISCAKLSWAVIDSGIDAKHPAFRLRDAARRLLDEAFPRDGRKRVNNTRVVATYDFTGIDLLLDPGNTRVPKALARRLADSTGTKHAKDLESVLEDVNASLASGRTIDWKLLAPLLEVPHTEEAYQQPAMDHGTHVAGILGGDWHADESDGAIEENLTGVCPDLRIYDLRVLDAEGKGDEFSVMAALQFVRYLNSTNDYVVVHGVNLSLSIPHDIANYACGRTPICDEAERVVNSGVVVVAAAGNQGYRKYATDQGLTAEAYNSASITDPGNAELVITVGATHRYRPHTYGVSYFSSRGPTGDGRRKPDLVAPGEKITAPLPGESFGLKDGTSMAAPHVSGAAALLMARHNELVGEPGRIKEILCRTATDLGRERYFQGAGMLDVLRALQSL